MGSTAERPERETESNSLIKCEKEQWLKLEVAWVLETTIGKWNTRVILSMQINGTNKLSIKKGELQILRLIWHLNIRSYIAMLLHTNSS